ncbi:hypothetical protein D1872_229850 [compost metagenome]
MAEAPLVTWYDSTNATQKTEWQIGTVDAGSVSSDTTFIIWNNRGGTTARADMTNCTITTKDSLGGNTGEVILNKWVEARVDTLKETTFTPIGGNTNKLIQAGGLGAGDAGKIKGGTNDGSTSATANHAIVTLHANVPATATAGNFSFLTRVAYQFQ